MNLHAMLLEAGFVREAKPWLESHETQAAIAGLYDAIAAHVETERTKLQEEIYDLEQHLDNERDEVKRLERLTNKYEDEIEAPKRRTA